MEKHKIFTPQTRQIVYALSGIVLALLATTGVVEEAAISGIRDALMGAYDAVIQAVVAGVAFMAAAKTHFGSDDRATEDDVEMAYSQGRAQAQAELAPVDEDPAPAQVEEVVVPEPPVFNPQPEELPTVGTEASGGVGLPVFPRND